MAKSKQMERRQRWLDGQREELKPKIAALRQAARVALGSSDTGRLGELVAAAKMLEAELAWAAQRVRDQRHPANRRSLGHAHDARGRAEKRFAALVGVVPEREWGFSREQEQELWRRAEAMADELLAQEVA